MLLVMDVGNTNIVIGLFEGDELVQRFRVQTVAGRTADETGALFLGLFRDKGLTMDVDASIISCVVPEQLSMLRDTCIGSFGSEPLVVGPGIKTGIPILADNPREVGADRIVNAVAAYELTRGPCIVVDFGTATTFDCISKRGEYLGGAIAPGYGISADALYRNASKLPRVEPGRPDNVIGRNTVHSMQSGLYFGYVSLVDGMVERIVEEMPDEPEITCLATGGLAEAIAETSEMIDQVVPDLTLDGLRILYARNLNSR